MTKGENMFCVTTSFKDCTDGELPGALCLATVCKGDCNACKDLECDRRHDASTPDWGNVRQLGARMERWGDRLQTFWPGLEWEAGVACLLNLDRGGSVEVARSVIVSMFLCVQNIRQLLRRGRKGGGQTGGWGQACWPGARWAKDGCVYWDFICSPQLSSCQAFSNRAKKIYSNKVDLGSLSAKKLHIWVI